MLSEARVLNVEKGRQTSRTDEAKEEPSGVELGLQGSV